MHPTSLPSGRLGADAYAFVDWLAAAGQSWWQMLPLGPPDEHGSPYKSASAFAASPHLLAEPDAPVSDAERRAFRAREAFWIGDWQAFGGAVDDQVRFDREWSALRAYANEAGVRLIGDIPIYVAPGGADHLTHPELFLPGFVAGAPPDQYTDLGQLWGNPMYDWPALRRRGYRWWVERLRRMTAFFDVSRIDHFRAFVAGWAVPATASDARSGAWRRGPGRAPFEAARRALGSLPFIAEDLGVITPAVERLRDSLGLPGMVVLQFGYDPSDPDSPHRVDRHAEHRVAYASTHDSDTVRGWYESASRATRELVDADLAARGIGGDDVAWSLIRLTFASPAEVAMVQAQDVLGLGSEGRMNVPGQEGRGAWTWRLEPGQLTSEHARRLRTASEEAGRL
ncbi:MAG TPA: 4-alpha-glucanotransferase [Solirubrobacteraceae bacterium]|nr:4-alpha-glucanotransferase [Solirubrobacteraceae bacterium]